MHSIGKAVKSIGILNNVDEIGPVNVIYWIGIIQNLMLLEQSRRGYR